MGTYGDVEIFDLHGYLLDAGVFTSFDVPNALFTFSLDINDAGLAVGYFIEQSSGLLRGFLRDADGEISTIHFPDSVDTLASGINDAGQMVGWYGDQAALDIHGFLLDGDEFTTFDFPGALTTAGADVNDRGQIVGTYIDTGGVIHSFFLDGGTFTTIDFPGSPNTQAFAINDSMKILGSYEEPASASQSSQSSIQQGGTGIFHSFVLPIFDPNAISLFLQGLFITFDHPESARIRTPHPGRSSGFGIDDIGYGTGRWIGEDNNIHGYTAEPLRADPSGDYESTFMVIEDQFSEEQFFQIAGRVLLVIDAACDGKARQSNNRVVTISGDRENTVTAMGPFDGSLPVGASGSGSIFDFTFTAEYRNVIIEQTAKQGTTIRGQYVVGAGGELPNGNLISYTFTGTKR